MRKKGRWREGLVEKKERNKGGRRRKAEGASVFENKEQRKLRGEEGCS